MLFIMRASWLAILVPALVFAAPAPSSDTIDPSLIGTWKLEVPGAPIFWVVPLMV